MADVDLQRTLEQVDTLEREIERIKRDLLQSLRQDREDTDVSSLYGSVEGGDITEEMVDEAKRSLFRTPGSGS